MTATVGNKLDWAHAEEAALGIAPNPADDQTLIDWATAEGGAGPEFGVPGNVTNYNPLNVSETTGAQGYGYDPGTGKFYPGSSPTSGNNPPIASFPDWTTGIQATADRLQEPFAAGILADLRAGAPESTTAAAVGASGWGTGDFAGIRGSGTAPATAGPGGAGVSGSAGGGTAIATTASLNPNPFDLFGIPQTVAGSVWTDIGPVLSKMMLVLGGVGIVVLAVWKAANPGTTVRQTVGDAANKAAEGAEAGAMA